MKVLLVSAYFPFKSEDSARAFVRDEAITLSEMGIDVHVAQWRYAGRFFKADETVLNGVVVHGLKTFSPKNLILGVGYLRRLPSSLFSLKRFGLTTVFFSYSKQIEHIVRRCDIDIIHAHFAYPDGFVGLLAKNHTLKPLVISIWGYDVQSDPKTGYGAFSRRDTAYLVSKALKAADAVVVGSKNHHRTVLQLVGEDEHGKVHFVPPGIDTGFFGVSTDGSSVRKKIGIEADRPVVLYARHLEPIYGVEYMINAVPYVINKCPKAVFVILGGGSLLTNMQKLVDDLKINDNVRFIDRVPKTDMPHWYAACDIFLDTCVFGQGYATLEALASGKPAIGFDVGQIKIEDGKDGFLVERNDVHEIAEKITWLIENPNERQKMGIYGRKRVEKCCSLKNRVREIKQIYEKVLSAQN